MSDSLDLPVEAKVNSLTGGKTIPGYATTRELSTLVVELSRAAGSDAALARLLGVNRGIVHKQRRGLIDSPTIRRILGINRFPPRARVTVNAQDMRSAARSLARVLSAKQIRQLISFLQEENQQNV